MKKYDERREYIKKMKQSDEWGTIIKLLVFCHLYDCEIRVAYATQANTFEFHSTYEALQLIQVIAPEITENLFKKRSNDPLGYHSERIGHIGSVFAHDPFHMDINRNKNHFIFLRPTDAKYVYLKKLKMSRRKKIVNVLLDQMQFEGFYELTKLITRKRPRTLKEHNDKRTPEDRHKSNANSYAKWKNNSNEFRKLWKELLL